MIKTLYCMSFGVALLGIPIAMETPAQDAYTKAFTDIADKFGLWAAITIGLMVVVIVTAWLRERRMAKRIDDLETALVEAVKAQKDAQIEVAKVQKDVQAALAAQTKVLEGLTEQTKEEVDVLKEIKIVFSQKGCPFREQTA